jgi:hypothetical protein
MATVVILLVMVLPQRRVLDARSHDVPSRIAIDKAALDMHKNGALARRPRRPRTRTRPTVVDIHLTPTLARDREVTPRISCRTTGPGGRAHPGTRRRERGLPISVPPRPDESVESGWSTWPTPTASPPPSSSRPSAAPEPPRATSPSHPPRRPSRESQPSPASTRRTCMPRPSPPSTAPRSTSPASTRPTGTPTGRSPPAAGPPPTAPKSAPRASPRTAPGRPPGGCSSSPRAPTHGVVLVAECPSCGRPFRDQRHSHLRRVGAATVCGNPLGQGPVKQCQHDLTTLGAVRRVADRTRDPGPNRRRPHRQERSRARGAGQARGIPGRPTAPDHAPPPPGRTTRSRRPRAMGGRPRPRRRRPHLDPRTTLGHAPTRRPRPPRPSVGDRGRDPGRRRPRHRSHAADAVDRAHPDHERRAARLAGRPHRHDPHPDSPRHGRPRPAPAPVPPPRHPQKPTERACRSTCSSSPRSSRTSSTSSTSPAHSDSSEATVRLFASLSLARLHPDITSWAAAAEALGMPGPMGVRCARACSASMLVTADEWKARIWRAGEESPRRDYRATEAKIRHRLGMSRWFDEWARQLPPRHPAQLLQPRPDLAMGSRCPRPPRPLTRLAGQGSPPPRTAPATASSKSSLDDKQQRALAYALHKRA